jgi:RND family efflux transporter MFP subunit
MPVQVAPVSMSPVPNSDTYVATIKSRRSSTMQPQVDGNIVKIFVKSGDAVKAGQVLMRIDPLKQMASVQSQQGTQAQKKALYDYNKIEVERQRKLYESGVVSRDTYDQANQAFENSKADYESNQALTDTQKQQLAYYDIRALTSTITQPSRRTSTTLEGMSHLTSMPSQHSFSGSGVAGSGAANRSSSTSHQRG